MQFEEFDKKAKEAADHHHPAYDEQAWTKMEKLLNKHLPQKGDDRRRFLFFLLLFLGVATIGLIIAKPWKSNKAMATTEQTVQQKQTANLLPTEPREEKANNDIAMGVNIDEVKNSTTAGSKESFADHSVINQPVVLAGNMPGKEKINKQLSFVTLRNVNKKNNQPVIITDNENLEKGNDVKDKTDDNRATTTPVAISAISSSANDVIATDKKQSKIFVADKPVAANTSPVINEPANVATINNESEPVAKNNDLKKPKNNNKKGNSFFFTLSTGPDVSFVINNKSGTSKLLTGAGIGYTFNNRFTLRTGFYSARKVYTASPDAYHPPANFYTYYPYLEKVDADCKVYEIPITVSYHFKQSAKQNWFVTAGISSYLMKEEKYNYFYKYTPSGPLHSRERTLYNENKHFLSTLTLSGGYQRNIGKHISIMAEPYVKLPLSGVGYGKVKLNSGGVLFSIGIKPFGTKNEKATALR